MTYHYDTLQTTTRGAFTVVVDKTWEDQPLADQFDETEFDIAQLARDIDAGKTEYFQLRVRVFLDGVELAAEYMGGLLYAEPNDVLADGTAGSMKERALADAVVQLAQLNQKFTQVLKELPTVTTVH